MKMPFNVLALVKNMIPGVIYLAPFCEIYGNKKVRSSYKLWFNAVEPNKHNSHGILPYNPETDVNQILSDSSRIIWAIVAHPEDQGPKHIGNVSLQRIDLLNRSAEIAIIIGEPDYFGKGIGRFAVAEICQHGFSKLGLNRIWSGTAATNIGMQKVFEKLGFQKEGVFKEAMYLDGQFVDVYEYGLLRPEYWGHKIKSKEIDESENQKRPMSFVGKALDNFLIDQIEQIRGKNNKHWMQLVRMAFKHDRESAQAIMKSIVECDRQVQEASSKLAKES